MARRPGSSMMWANPPPAIATNQTTVIGPKKLATRAVPCDCSRNRPMMTRSATGTTNRSRSGATSLRPSTAEHRDRGRDHGIAEEERGAGDAEPEQQGHAAAGHALAQRHQGEDAALAVVVGAQQHNHVLQRHDQRERPEDEREHPDHRLARDGAAALSGGHRLAEGIERARADVAIDDTDGAERKRPEVPARGWLVAAQPCAAVSACAIRHLSATRCCTAASGASS